MANIKYVNAEALLSHRLTQYPSRYDLEQAVEELSTADVAEVVRCKDCKYCKLMKDVKNEKLVYLHCRMMNCFIKNDSFCSYGERKENV